MVHPEISVLLSTFRITKQAVACKNAPGAFAQPVVAPVKKGYFLEETSGELRWKAHFSFRCLEVEEQICKTNVLKSKDFRTFLVEISGIEPLTS